MNCVILFFIFVKDLINLLQVVSDKLKKIYNCDIVWNNLLFQRPNKLKKNMLKKTCNAKY